MMSARRKQMMLFMNERGLQSAFLSSNSNIRSVLEDNVRSTNLLGALNEEILLVTDLSQER
jgi:hypothetical protein